MKYGQAVTLVRNGVELNALVVEAQADGHLTVVYLDPAFGGQMLGGSGVQRAIATAFVVPLKEGAVNGWKDNEVQQIAAANAGTDGTSPSDSAPVDASVAAKEEPGDEREAPPAPPQQ